MDDSFRRGVALGLPYAAVGFLLSASFGVLATQAGFTPMQAVLTSALVFAGSAQFTALSVVAAGGGLPAAVSAAAMMHGRFLAMGVALAPSLPGGPLRRAVQGQAVVDASWAMASRGDGSFDRRLLFGATAPQYLTWLGGTVLGAYGGGLLGDTERWGLDAIYPTFFLALLITEVRRGGSARRVAVAGAVIAVCLVPLVPPGVPILVAAVAALLGLGTGGRP